MVEIMVGIIFGITHFYPSDTLNRPFIEILVAYKGHYLEVLWGPHTIGPLV